MAKRGTLDKAAVNIGRTLGQVANRLDKLHIQRDAITAEIRRLAHAGTEMLSKVGHVVQHEVDVAKSATGKRLGRKPGFKMSAAARRKISIAAKKRHAAARAQKAAKTTRSGDKVGNG